MDYSTIKEMAKEQGISIEDLCALASKNDPFYTGRKSEVAAAEWFADLWRRFGYTTGVHLRRVHYQIISQEQPVKLPTTLSWKDKKTEIEYETDEYLNVERCWDYLTEAGKWARYLGLVDPAAFVDRRNPKAIINARWKNPGDWNYEDPTPGYRVSQEDWYRDLPDLPALGGLDGNLPNLPDFEVTGYTTSWGEALNQQAYHVEVWVEKTTMNDVLEPLCQRHKVNLITGAGEISITAVVDFMKRVRPAQRPARILYVSDYDPAGLGMPISVARKIEFFQRQNGESDLDIRLQPVVLTGDQVAEYRLPRVPVKDSDLRKANWEAAHGEGQVELDALEALHEGELGIIVEAAILEYHDPELVNKTLEAKGDLEEALDTEHEAVMESYQSELDDIEADYAGLVGEVDELRERFDELVEPFQEEIDAYKERLEAIKERWEDVRQAVADDLEAIDVDPAGDYPLPKPGLPEEDDGLLYDSGRGYLEQLDYYKCYRGGDHEQDL